MKKEFDVDVEIYRTSVHVIVTDNLEEEYSNLGLKYTPGYAAFYLLDREDKLEYSHYIVLNDKFTIGELHHETIHCANKILGMAGVEFGYENDEALTYLSQYIFEEILSHLCGEEDGVHIKI